MTTNIVNDALSAAYGLRSAERAQVSQPALKGLEAPQAPTRDVLEISSEAQDILRQLTETPGNERKAALVLMLHMLQQRPSQMDAQAIQEAVEEAKAQASASLPEAAPIQAASYAQAQQNPMAEPLLDMVA